MKAAGGFRLAWQSSSQPLRSKPPAVACNCASWWRSVPGLELDLVNVRAAGILLRREVMGGTLLWGPGDFFYEYRLFAYRDCIDSADLRKLGRVLMEKRLKYIKEQMDAPV